MQHARACSVNTSPDDWIAQIFSAKAAQGGVVREVGQERFMTEVRARGFHLLASRTQFIVVCHRDPVHLLFWLGFSTKIQITRFRRKRAYPRPSFSSRAARSRAKSSPA